MATAIVSAVGWLVGYFAAKGIDHILAKWVASFAIAWDRFSSEKAKAVFRESTQSLQVQLADKSAEWKAWRDSLKPKG